MPVSATAGLPVPRQPIRKTCSTTARGTAIWIGIRPWDPTGTLPPYGHPFLVLLSRAEHVRLWPLLACCQSHR